MMPAAPEAGPASWTFDPTETIGPDTTAFTAMVTEVACASGRSSEDRIVGPTVEPTVDAVIVTFRVVPLAGNQDCPSNPPTRVRVELGEALGARRLFDGGRHPPQEPPVCASPQACE